MKKNRWRLPPSKNLASLLAKRKISPVELTEIFLRRIERQNPALNAFMTVTGEHALAAARRAEKQFPAAAAVRGVKIRPLLGIPITLKDNIWTRGIRSTAGSKILQRFRSFRGCHRRAKTCPRRRHSARQNKPERICLRDYRRQRALRPGRTIRGRSIGFPADRARAPPSRLPRAFAWLPSAPTPADRSAFLPLFAGSSG